MTELLKNFVAGQWIAGAGSGTLLRDPVTGADLVRVCATAAGNTNPEKTRKETSNLTGRLPL